MTKARTGAVDRRRNGSVYERRSAVDRERYSVDGCTEDIRRSYVKIYGSLLSYARGRVGSKEAAHDIVQEAFTNTLAAADRGALLNNVDGFLYRCVQNLCINHARREPPLSLSEETFAMTNELNGRMTEPSAGFSASQRERWREVEGTVKKLAPSQRYVFLLAEVRGFRYEEIAGAMGKSVESIRQLLSRARKKVRAGAGKSSDRIGGSIPVLGAACIAFHRGERALTGMLGRLRMMASEANTWIGSQMQRGLDAALQSGAWLTAGALVSLLAVSPGTSAQGQTAVVESISSSVEASSHTALASPRPAVVPSPRLPGSELPGQATEREEVTEEDRSGASGGEGTGGGGHAGGGTADVAAAPGLEPPGSEGSDGDTLAPPPAETLTGTGSSGSGDDSLSGRDEKISDSPGRDTLSEATLQGSGEPERNLTGEAASQAPEAPEVDAPGGPALPESEEPSQDVSGDVALDEHLP